MALSVKRLSIVAGALAILAEAGINNGLLALLVYTGASAVTAPVLLESVQTAHDAAEARLAADRARTDVERPHGRQVNAEPGDAEQRPGASEGAQETPDMPRRLEPMLAQRRAFLAGYGGDAARAGSVRVVVEKMLRDDRLALAAFTRRARREPVWAAVHSAEVAELRAMDGRLADLESRFDR